MPSVFLCSPYNSTTFTTCCQCAIGGEKRCPNCGEEIEGYEENAAVQVVENNRFRLAFQKQKRGL